MAPPRRRPLASLTARPCPHGAARRLSFAARRGDLMMVVNGD
jgi:hypothetical protein